MNILKRVKSKKLNILDTVPNGTTLPFQKVRAAVCYNWDANAKVYVPADLTFNPVGTLPYEGASVVAEDLLVYRLPRTLSMVEHGMAGWYQLIVV